MFLAAATWDIAPWQEINNSQLSTIFSISIKSIFERIISFELNLSDEILFKILGFLTPVVITSFLPDLFIIELIKDSRSSLIGSILTYEFIYSLCIHFSSKWKSI